MPSRIICGWLQARPEKAISALQDFMNWVERPATAHCTPFFMGTPLHVMSSVLKWNLRSVITSVKHALHETFVRDLPCAGYVGYPLLKIDDFALDVLIHAKGYAVHPLLQ
jgi:hypothetical protein